MTGRDPRFARPFEGLEMMEGTVQPRQAAIGLLQTLRFGNFSAVENMDAPPLVPQKTCQVPVATADASVLIEVRQFRRDDTDRTKRIVRRHGVQGAITRNV